MELRERLDKLKKKQKGFTLVELIVVIAIIGILAGVMLPQYFGFTDDARENAALAEAKSIRTVFETYYAQHGSWPTISVTAATATTAATTTVNADTHFTADGTITLNSPSDGGFEFVKNNGLVATNGYTVTCDPDGTMEVDET